MQRIKRRLSEIKNIDLKADLLKLKRWLSTQPHSSIAGWHVSDPALVSKLREYVYSGLEAGDTCVLIVSSVHLKQLHEKRARDNDISRKLFDDQCIVSERQCHADQFHG